MKPAVTIAQYEMPAALPFGQRSNARAYDLALENGMEGFDHMR